MDEQQMEQILSDIKKGHQNPFSESHEYFWKKMHGLAEAKYVPAQSFFVTCLDDPRSDWREDCLTCLGFHYQFAPDSNIIVKIRQMLLNDPDAFVRLAATSILGIRSYPSDYSLIAAMQNDIDEDVRLSAFDALLTLTGLPSIIVRQQVEHAREGKVETSLEEVERIKKEWQGN